MLPKFFPINSLPQEEEIEIYTSHHNIHSKALLWRLSHYECCQYYQDQRDTEIN